MTGLPTLVIDNNVLYYTLSTIAQTLAGALAVLVAIVPFNFSRVNDAFHGGNVPRKLTDTSER